MFWNERVGESWHWPPAPGPGDRGGRQGPGVQGLDEVRPGPRMQDKVGGTARGGSSA